MTFDPTAHPRAVPLARVEVGGRPVAYFDGPGGTQVPQRVIDAIVAYYREANANDGGAFITSERSDARVADAHAAVADVYGAEADEIKFGANMTSLTFHVSRSIGATLSAGDQIVVTTLDHEANVSTWRAMAADRGVHVRTVDIHDDGTLDLDDLDRALATPTRLVAVGYASNALGTINPVADIVAARPCRGRMDLRRRRRLRPHGPIDVEGARYRVPRQLPVQVVRAARRRPLRQARDPRVAARVQGPARARPIRDRDPELRGDRRDGGRGGLPASLGRSGRRRAPAPRVGRGCSPGWTASGRTRRRSTADSWPGSRRSPACTSGASPTRPGSRPRRRRPSR